MHDHAPILLAAAVALAPACSSSVPVSPEPAVTAVGPTVAALTASSSPPLTSPPAAARPRSTATPAEAAALLAHADKCLADFACTEDADALYRAADDAGAKDVSCFRFYYGTGITKDLGRARACFERRIAAVAGCGGSSPDLDRLYLASMLVDAQGGPADAARAEALFADCFKDAAVGGVREEVPKRAQPDPARAPLDFCQDIGGTTLSIGACLMVEQGRVVARRIQVEKLILPRLDAAGKKLAEKARAAWDDAAANEAAISYDVHKEGSIRSIAYTSRQNALLTRRAEAMAHLFDDELSAGADLAGAERDLGKAYAEACKQDADRKKVCAASRGAWTAYRDAEVALYVHVHGASLGDKDVARDVKITLTRQYQADLEDVLKP
jgi:uncharacterized protein YecT (DUF1311 family)